MYPTLAHQWLGRYSDIVQFCAQANARYMRQWAAFAAMGPKVPGVKMPLGLEVLSSWTLSLTPAFRKGNLWGFLTCQRSGRRKRRRKKQRESGEKTQPVKNLGKGGAGFCPPYSFWMFLIWPCLFTHNIRLWSHFRDVETCYHCKRNLRTALLQNLHLSWLFNPCWQRVCFLCVD